MKKLLMFVCVGMMIACNTTQAIHLPNGQMGYEVSCGGTMRSWGSCMNEAAELCNGQYTILDQNVEQTGYSDQYGYHPIVKRKMIIVCK